jgi:membrane-bound serine protease (ClpP class)
MDGLILLVIALCLIVAEAFAPSFGLLGVAGIIAFLSASHMIVEAGGIFGIPLGWGFFIGMLVVVTIPAAIAAYLTGKYFRKQSVTGAEGMIGQEARVVEWSGRTGRVQIQGELWSAHSQNDYVLNADDTVIVSAVDDVSLRIHLKS